MNTITVIDEVKVRHIEDRGQAWVDAYDTPPDDDGRYGMLQLERMPVYRIVVDGVEHRFAMSNSTLEVPIWGALLDQNSALRRDLLRERLHNSELRNELVAVRGMTLRQLLKQWWSNRS